VWNAKGLKRHYGQGHLHFLTFSCYRRLPLLGVREQETCSSRNCAGSARVWVPSGGLRGDAESCTSVDRRAKEGHASTVLQMLKQRVSRKMRLKERAAPKGQLSLRFPKFITSCRSSGSRGFTISTYTATRRRKKNWSICTRILWCEDS